MLLAFYIRIRFFAIALLVCFTILVIYMLSGKLIAKKENYIAVDVSGVGYKIFISPKTHEELPILGGAVKLFSYLNVKEDALDLYGFVRESDLTFFEKLITVNGVGPKSALAVMSVAPVDQLMAAINEGKPELLTRASGVGRKIAERLILELKGKLPMIQSVETVEQMQSDMELEDVLVGLGYNKNIVKGVVKRIDQKLFGLEPRLKNALKLLKK